MSDSSIPYMPKGQVSVGNGTLQFVTTASFDADNGMKLKHSLRKSPSGYTRGNNEITGTIEIDVSEDGPERDFFDMWKSGKPVAFVFEVPNEDVELNCAVKKIGTSFPNDDAVHRTVEFVAWLP